MTQETLKELQAGQIPCLYVMNKADLVMEESELPKVLGDRIYLSAKQGIGLAELLELIQKKLFGDYRECTFLIPYTMVRRFRGCRSRRLCAAFPMRQTAC